MSDVVHPGERDALTAALSAARRCGRLRELPTLEDLRAATRPFFSPGSGPRLLETWIHEVGAFYAVAVVPASAYLDAGDWWAGPVTCDGRAGIAVVLVVDEAIARTVER